MSNLRQVGLAVLQYTQDNDEFFVLTERGGDIDDAHEYYWGDMLQPYIKSWAMLTLSRLAQTCSSSRRRRRPRRTASSGRMTTASMTS